MPEERRTDGLQSLAHLGQYSLLDALTDRRSRRFGRGMRIPGGPLAYESGQPPSPLTLEEEAALAFAACGVTGPTLADMAYAGGAMPEAGGGNILAHLVGRTVASADAIHAVVLFVMNDEGTWMLWRPQDFPRARSACWPRRRGSAGLRTSTGAAGCGSPTDAWTSPVRSLTTSR